MRVLGINAYTHDAGVALIDDGQVVFALEEERLNREPKTTAFPVGGIHELRTRFNIDLDSIDQIGIPWHPPSLVRSGVKLVFGQFPPAFRLLSRKASPTSNVAAWLRFLRASLYVVRSFRTEERSF